MFSTSPRRLAAPWIEHRTIWRWHFYAGLFCIPFVTWLSITGSIYLFKPQIESWLDRPYDNLNISGPRTTGDSQIRAALAAVPGSSLHDYELPQAPDSAIRVIVGRGAEEFRVYVHPATLATLNVANEDKRPMKVLFHLHGDLLSGDRGSMIVELAASWAIVLILTGLFLWWPRQKFQAAGMLYPRLNQGGRLFWRDLHSVTGLWISFLVLFLLVSGLPWAKSWGAYLKQARKVLEPNAGKIDWTTGRSSEIAARIAKSGEHAGHTGKHRASVAGLSYEPVDRLMATVAPLNLAYPVLLSPPTQAGGNWTARSEAGNRTLRTNLDLDSATGKIIKRQDFGSKPFIDRAVGFGVAAHEGQLFPLNQVVNLIAAVGLNILNISGIMMWLRRRPKGVLGAPVAVPNKRSARWIVALPAAVLGVVLPLLGISIIAMAAAEFLALRRIPAASRWLGLSASA
jgi:uncharacterized iron-regulated membrane protein